MISSVRVGLVASVPDGTEPLGLEFVAAALRRAGHHPELVTFRGVGDLEHAARRALALEATVVGVAIPSGVAAIDSLAFILRLRRLGFSGHITCGGAFATLCRRRLLETSTQIDSVVRHRGEDSIAGLVRAVVEGIDLSQVPGVTTRRGDGPPAPLIEPREELEEELDLVPERPAPHLFAGVSTAKISAVRGCWGRCDYCGLRALRREHAREASTGVGISRRPIDSVADEMARLYHEREVRFFHFVDENHLPRSENEAQRVIRDLDRALADRAVGKRAVQLMLRADSATPEVVAALRRLGLVRCLLGVESTTAEGLHALGRGSASAETGYRAMDLLHRAGVTFHFNLLLIRPDSTQDAIDLEIEGLQRVRGGLIDPFQVEPFEGTDLFDRLRRQDRLEGGPLIWWSWPAEAIAGRFARIFYRLRRDVFGPLRVTDAAYEVLGAAAVARQLDLGGLEEEEIVELISIHNALWIETLTEASALARRQASAEEIDAFVASTRQLAAGVVLRVFRLGRHLERSRRGQPKMLKRTLRRAATAAATALTILGAGGCGPASTPRDAGDAMAGDADSLDSDVDMEAAVDADSLDSDVDLEAAVDADSLDSDVDVEADVDASACGTSSWDEERGIQSDAADAACQMLCATDGDEFRYRYLLDAEGRVVDIERDDGQAIPAEVRRCYLDAVAGQTFPCLAASSEHWFVCNVLLA